MPFLCFVETGTRSFGADGIVYYYSRQVQIVLYSQLKDPALEARVEAVLDENGIYWEKSNAYLSDENCWEIIFTSEV